MSGDELVEKVRYEADISDIQSKLRTLSDKQGELAKDTEGHTKKITGAWGGVKTFLSSGATWFSGLAAGGAAIAVKNILDTGSQLQALDQKAKTVFSGTSLAGVQDWSKKVAAGMGMTSSQAVAMASSMGDLFKPMGFSADAAAGMAVQLGDLSGALSAWSGGKQSAAQVSDTITKAMLGERDGLKELGISINDNDVQQRLAKNGTDKLTGAALEQAKALATQQLIMEKSTDAQKAWADGSMDGVKKQNEAKSSVSQLGETVTRMLFPALAKLVPIVSKVAMWLGDHLPAAFAKIGEVIAWLRTNVLPALQKVWEAVALGAAKLVGWIQGHWAKISSVVEQAIGFVRGAINTGVAAIEWIWNNFGQNIVATLKVAWGFISGIVQAALDIVHGIINTVMGLIHGDWSQVWDGLKGIVTGVFDAISTIVKTAIGAVGVIISTAWNAVKAIWSGIWDGLKGAVTSVKDWVGDRITDIVNFAINLPSRIGHVFSGMWDGIKDAFKTALNWIIEKWNNFHIPAMHVMGVQISPQIDFPDLPMFHSGGIVPGPPGMERLALVQSGEQILTRQQQAQRGGGGGAVINGNVIVQTGGDSPRRWIDELSWRVTG